MLVRGVVRDDVYDHLDVLGVQLGDHLVELVEGADAGIHVAVVVHVVAAVRKLRGIEGAQPYGVNTEIGEVIDAGNDALQIADAVSICISKRAGVDLINHCLTPPVGVLDE